MIFTNNSLRDAVAHWMQNKTEAQHQWGPIEFWDTSQVTDMGNLFNANMDYVMHGGQPSESFECDLSRWDTSKVTNMDFMFAGAIAFTSDLSAWDTSQVCSMRYMFSCASSFTSDLSNWNTSQVVDMAGMFRWATRFSSNLARWDTSQVCDMSGMFMGTSLLFDVSRWNVHKVTTMDSMFHDSRFGSIWNITNLTEARSNASYFQRYLFMHAFMHLSILYKRRLCTCIYL
jgi:surface protein